MRRKPGSAFAVIALTLLFGGALTFGRAAENAKIEGVALDTSGTAIAQAWVTLQPPSGAEARVATDAKGAFSFDNLAAGTYALTINAPGFQRTRFTNITLKGADTRQFDFTLRSGAVSETVEYDITRPPTLDKDRESRLPDGGSTLPRSGAGVISGRIRDAGGASAFGVTVGAIAVDQLISGFLPQTLSFHTRTDSLGFYRLDNLPAGRYLVVAGAEGFSREGSVIDRPVFFPGVSDASRAVAITAGLGREETADFRLDSPSIFPSISTRSSVFRVSGQLINESVLALPLAGQSQWVGRPIAWGQIRVTMEPAVISILGVDAFSGIQRPQTACAPPARASFASAVTNEGRFDFSLPTGVYDLCVFAQGGAAVLRGGGGSSGRGAWGAVAGPFSLVVDRDINSLLVDIGRR